MVKETIAKLGLKMFAKSCSFHFKSQLYGNDRNPNELGKAREI